MTEKKQERIIDKPTPEQVKAVLEKAKKAAQEKKKGSPAASPDKMDMLLEKIEGLIKRQDRLEQVYTKGVVLPTGSLSSEKKATGHEKQATNEELLAEAEAEQERLAHQEQPGEQPGQQSGQLSPQQYEKLPDSEKVKLLEQQLQLQQQQKTGKGGLNGQAALYGLLEIAKTTSPVIIEAIKAKGGHNSNPLEAFFGQLGVYQKIQGTIMDGFFNFMRNLSPGERQTRMDAIAKSPPGNYTRETDQGRIKESGA